MLLCAVSYYRAVVTDYSDKASLLFDLNVPYLTAGTLLLLTAAWAVNS